MTAGAARIARLHSWRMLGVGSLLLLPTFAFAEPEGPETPVAASRPPVLTLEAAVSYALSNNPTLAVQRQQHGIAAARVVIADPYPFNPIRENRIQAAVR